MRWVGADVFVKHVDDDVAVVEERPAALTLAGQRPFVVSALEVVDHAVGDGARLPVAVRGDNDQKVGVRTVPLGLNNSEALAFAILGRSGCG